MSDPTISFAFAATVASVLTVQLSALAYILGHDRGSPGLFAMVVLLTLICNLLLSYHAVFEVDEEDRTRRTEDGVMIDYTAKPIGLHIAAGIMSALMSATVASAYRKATPTKGG